jgi:hypothetical protein
MRRQNDGARKLRIHIARVDGGKRSSRVPADFGVPILQALIQSCPVGRGLASRVEI